jgi:hypothetical protein
MFFDGENYAPGHDAQGLGIKRAGQTAEHVRVGGVHVDDVEFPLPNYPGDAPCRKKIGFAPHPDGVHGDAVGACALAYGARRAGDKLGRMSSFPKAFDEKKGLALAAAPGGLVVDMERSDRGHGYASHPFPWPVAMNLCTNINLPKLLVRLATFDPSGVTRAAPKPF